MADNHPLRVAAAAENGLLEDTMLEAGVRRIILALGATESLGDFEFSIGEIPIAVAYAATGFLYFYDSADSTTPDDGVTCLVTGNGLRYHIEDSAALSLNAALSFETAPPGSPVIGDVHIVDAAATGGFAGHDDDVAFYTRRGWVFATPEIGHTLLLQDTGTNWQFGVTGWGGFSGELASDAVRPEAMLLPMGLAVETTENSPPGSPAADTYWLVGTVPTGDFVGHTSDVAYHDGAAWQFLIRYAGATIFHKGFGFPLHYVSGQWLGGAGSDMQEFNTAGAATWTKPAKGTVALIQGWGAGGSGAYGSSGGTSPPGGGGGGGGAYVEALVPLASLATTVAVTVGAGGVARTSVQNGQPGGSSSFGTLLVAPGGGGGGSGGWAGGGAGQGSAGGTGSSANGTPGTDLSGFGTSKPSGGGVFGTENGSAIFGGGAGGMGDGAGTGGNSGYGGGGGGGGRSAGFAGGVSKFGGNGGDGHSSTTGTGTAGAQPGGGGGGSRGGNSGKGGDGRIRVTVF